MILIILKIDLVIFLHIQLYYMAMLYLNLKNYLFLNLGKLIVDKQEWIKGSF